RGYRALHDHAAGGVAALAGGEARSVNGSLRGEVEVGIGADDERVAAAEFEGEILGKIGRQLLCERAADRHGARKAHGAHARIEAERLTFGAAALHELK